MKEGCPSTYLDCFVVPIPVQDYDTSIYQVNTKIKRVYYKSLDGTTTTDALEKVYMTDQLVLS